MTVCPATSRSGATSVPTRMRGPCRSSSSATGSRRPLVTSRSSLHPALTNLGGAVRSVDPDDVDAGVDQRGHLRGVVPRGAQRGDDLGAADRIARHGTESNAAPSPPHHDLAADHREAGRSRSRGVAGAALDRGVERPGHQIRLLAGRQRARSVAAGRDAPRLQCRPARPRRTRASPPAATPRPAHRRRSGARGRRRGLRADRSTQPARRSQRPSACGASAAIRTRTHPGRGRPSDDPRAGCRSTGARAASRRRVRRRRPDRGRPRATHWKCSIRCGTATRRSGAMRSSARRTAASPIACTVDAIPAAAAARMARAASSSDVIGMPRSRLPS